MNVNDGTDTTCPTCGSGARQSVIKLRAENARLRATIEECLLAFGDEYPARMSALEAALRPPQATDTKGEGR